MVMGVSLYTVRAILHQLGIVDYGIYNVVGGVVNMFSFLNGMLSTASQRYFSIELAKGDKRRLNQWFCLNITGFSIIILLFLVLAETIGLWFVNTQMTIPEERLFAANVVYQLSIVSFCIHFFNIPYTALVIAHERMGAFAYISIMDVMLKLVIVFLLMMSPWDKLVVYAFLMFLLSCGVTSIYIIYSMRLFEEAKYRPYWNTSEIKELLNFSGWHLFGTVAMVVRSGGINILLNIFFNPAINAARAIAYQVYKAVNQLSGNFFVAVKPQIYKSYAAGDYEDLYKLILRSTMMCSFLVSILIYPVLANTSYILGLWLKEVPDYAVIFTQLVLVNGLIDATNGPTIAPALATGKIRNYQLTVSTLILLNFPISYVALRMGAEPTVTMQVSISLSFVTAIVRAYLLRIMIKLPFRRYMVLFLRIVIASIFIWSVISLAIYNGADSLVSLLGWSVFVAMLVVGSYLCFVMERSDVRAIINLVRRR